MFIGVERTGNNERTLTFLENVILDPEHWLDRVLFCGSEQGSLLLMNALTVLSFRGYKVAYFREQDILNTGSEPGWYNRGPDIVALDGLFSQQSLTEEQAVRLHDFLNIHQHSHLWVTTRLSSDQIFSPGVIQSLDSGTTWSRTFLGCKQLFLETQELNRFLELARNLSTDDYRLIQTIDFLSHPVKPYNEFEGVFTRHDIVKALVNGNDRQNNVLTVSTSGIVGLRNFNHIKNFHDIAVRSEAYMAGNGYVGSEPTTNELDETYLLLLEGYLTYLETGEEQFRDVRMSRDSEHQLLIAIKKRLGK
ncbi:hypothetical protein [Alicyclobacillus sp. ALC3]|uniref:hypothetical protein n=1 Tax=Alicyclobacillus sp. ALC3 TaxID=2796143 RepID=UPI0023785D85|nr:hypothetical protein [Alicyclobacillus sp. ALC3]WDL99203.1 hypothetical protein JC200_11480 [Alicyclobacillus sp. ALC3]